MIAPLIVSCSGIESERPALSEHSAEITQAQVDSVVSAKFGLVRVPVDLQKAEALGVDVKSNELVNVYLDLASKRYLYVEHSRGNDALYYVESTSALRMRGSEVERSAFSVSNTDKGLVISRLNDQGLPSLENEEPPYTIEGIDHDQSPKPKKEVHFFCQREGQETFEQCYDREVAEFCDDLVGRVAYETHVSIRLLIAASCTCHQ